MCCVQDAQLLPPLSSVATVALSLDAYGQRVLLQQPVHRLVEARRHIRGQRLM